MHQPHGISRPSRAPIPWPAIATFTTKNLLEVKRHLKAYDVSAELDIHHPSLFRGYRESFVRLHDIALSMTRIDSPDGYDLGFRPSHEYCLNIPMQGRGWIANGLQVIETDHTQAVLVSPRCEITKHWRGPSDVLTVHIPAHTLHSNAEFALPRDIAPVSVIGRDKLHDFLMLLDVLRKVCNDRRSPMAEDAILRHLESALIGTLLRCLHNGASEPTPRTVAVPYYVRQADHYMRANFKPGLTLKDIALAVGVSERTLQYGFKHSYGKTPLQFFKQLRLNAARTQIVAGLRGKTLSELAWAVGYRKSSQFAADYRAAFGENPSATARYASHASLAMEATGSAATPLA